MRDSHHTGSPSSSWSRTTSSPQESISESHHRKSHGHYPNQESLYERKPSARKGGSFSNRLGHGAGSITPTSSFTRRTTRSIEVSPGHFMCLRGAAETTEAIYRDFYTPCRCFACSDSFTTTIFCISDANYVLCPHCKVVSPVSEHGDEWGGRFWGDTEESVGLGFTFETLADILSHNN